MRDKQHREGTSLTVLVLPLESLFHLDTRNDQVYLYTHMFQEVIWRQSDLQAGFLTSSDHQHGQ